MSLNEAVADPTLMRSLPGKSHWNIGVLVFHSNHGFIGNPTKDDVQDIFNSVSLLSMPLGERKEAEKFMKLNEKNQAEQPKPEEPTA